MSWDNHVGDDDYDEEDVAIPLYESSRERESMDEKANLYAIIMATEHLERAFARDAISAKEYTAQCKKLISQFKLAERILRSEMSTETFMQIYQMDCPRATERLLKMGVPEPIKGDSEDANTAVKVAETVAAFITVTDAIRLDIYFQEELQPRISDLLDCLMGVPNLPSDFKPIQVTRKWLEKLNTMRAFDEITQEDARQMHHDIDSAHVEFVKHLKSSGN